MNKSISNIILVVLILGNVFFMIKYFSAKRETKEAQIIANSAVMNHKVLDFTVMFIRDVLKASKEVSFETRLTLETNVRDLNDQEILTEWQNFTNSKTEDSAQESVKKLLEVLITKIKKPV